MSGISERDLAAHHESGHAVAGRLAGLSTRIHVGDGDGWCRYSDATTPSQVHGRQVAALAGGMAEAKRRREDGEWAGGGYASGADLANFRWFADWDGAIGLGQAKREARTLVNRHWSAIRAMSAPYLAEREKQR